MVGADGATHVGAFDVTFMASLPHMVTMAPSNEAELINMVATAVAIDDRPSCFRCARNMCPIFESRDKNYCVDFGIMPLPPRPFSLSRVYSPSGTRVAMVLVWIWPRQGSQRTSREFPSR